MRSTKNFVTLSLCVVMVAGPAIAQRISVAETGLVGIKLYDPGLKLLNVYGNPDEMQPLGASGAPTGGGGGGGAAPSPAPGPAGGAAPPPVRGGGAPATGGGAAAGGGIDFANPFDFGDELLRQRGALQPGTGGERPPAAGGGQAPAPGGGAGGSVGGPASFVRWVYKRGGSKYGFILDRYNRVVQIEAIGLENKKVVTRKGIGFGADFKKVYKTYGIPDGYEIAGNSLTMRYLVRNKVAFRLNRLGLDRPFVVTGIVVAAGR